MHITFNLIFCRCPPENALSPRLRVTATAQSRSPLHASPKGLQRINNIYVLFRSKPFTFNLLSFKKLSPQSTSPKVNWLTFRPKAHAYRIEIAKHVCRVPMSQFHRFECQSKQNSQSRKACKLP